MVIQLIIIAVLIMLSAFFSASETALTGANRIRLRSMAENGSKGAKKALKLAEKYDKVITTILIGNNIVNIAASSIAALVAAQLIEDKDIAALVSTLVLTVAVLTFGEVIPKGIANDRSERMTVHVSGILSLLTILFTPFSALFILLKKGVSKLFKNSEKEVTVTEQELIALVDEIEDEGVLEEQESDLVKSALTFDETTIDEVITHRVDIVAVDVNDDEETVKRIFISEGYSRLPVYEGSVDNMIGFVSQKDFFKACLSDDKPEIFNLRDILRDIKYFSHLSKLSEVMRTMQKEKAHMAVVLDQYGGTLGIVTLEDILEQLVGEIWDENDEIVLPVSFVSENKFDVAGDTSVREFRRFWENRTGEKSIANTDAKTVGGWALELFGRIPKIGEKVAADGFSVLVLEVSNRRIVKLRFEITKSDE